MSSEFRFKNFAFRIGHERITYSVQFLLLANIAVFVAQLLFEIPFGTNFETVWLGFSPVGFLDGFVWTPFTYMFLHSGLSHLFFNMLMLYFFGPEVETLLGTRQFTIFYITCGVLGVLANFVPILLFGSNPNVFVVGASGATIGILVAFAIIEPDRKIFLFPIPVPVNARILVIFILVMNIVAALNPGNATSVATHFGGMATAFAYMKLRPHFPRWRIRRKSRGASLQKDLDKLGEEIDNIFKFQDPHKK